MSWGFGMHLFAGRKAKESPAIRNGRQPASQGGRTTPERIHVTQATQPIAQAQPSPLSAIEIADLDDLKEEITSAMPEIELDKACYYLPEKKLSDIVTRERIAKVFPNIMEDLVEFIMESGKKLFVITINSVPANHIIAAMREFKIHGLNDEDLPIEGINHTCKSVPSRGGPLLRGKDSSLNCNHDPKFDVFHHYPWNLNNRRSFCGNQWGLLVPRLTMNQFEKFETNRILPITEKTPRSVGGGHFSQVFKAKLLADCQDHFPEVIPFHSLSNYHIC
jgi:hypothetical protein